MDLERSRPQPIHYHVDLASDRLTSFAHVSRLTPRVKTRDGEAIAHLHWKGEKQSGLLLGKGVRRETRDVRRRETTRPEEIKNFFIF